MQAVNVPEPAAIAATPPFEHEAAIHEEIERLPDPVRDAVTLCELRGVTRADAAAILRIPEGTLSSRLAAGRKKLAERLARRGVAPSAALVAVAAVPETLVAATCRIAAGIAIPANIERLMRGGLPMRTILIGVMGFGLAAAGAVLTAKPETPPVRVAAPAAEAAAEPKTKTAPAETFKYTSKPRLQKTLDIQANVKRVVWSPDGKWLLLDGPSIVVWNLETRSRGELNLATPNRFVAITPAKQVVTQLRESGLLSGLHVVRLWGVNGPGRMEAGGSGVASGGGPGAFGPGIGFEQTREHTIDPESMSIYGFPKDGDTIRTVRTRSTKPGVLTHVEVLESKLDSTASKSVFAVDTECDTVVLAPSGGRIAILNKTSITIHEIAEGKKTTFDKLPEANPPLKDGDGRRRLAAFSPDETKVVTALIGRSPVILSLTGDKPVTLEGVEPFSMSVTEASFSAGNRLVSMRGVRYGPRPGPGGRVTEGLIGSALFVWDAQTGKVVKLWEPFDVTAAFHPSKPTLAIVEPNGSSGRLGLWDFSAEGNEKK